MSSTQFPKQKDDFTSAVLFAELANGIDGGQLEVLVVIVLENLEQDVESEGVSEVLYYVRL